MSQFCLGFKWISREISTKWNVCVCAAYGTLFIVAYLVLQA